MKLKRFFAIFLICLLTFFCVACGEYTQPTSDKVVGGNSSTSTPPDGGGEEDGNEKDDEYFTVQLLLDGKPFTGAEGAVAQWSDGVSSHLAAINAEGFARISGLDGEYHVTLLYLDDAYAYNPNLNEVNNDNTDISINIYEVIKTKKSAGAELYACKNITKGGVYRTELKSASDVVYYEFEPSGGGSYIVETWVDITANVVAPSIDVYTGHSNAKYFSETLTDGGIFSDYTKNVKHVLNLDNLQTGHSFTFGIKARQRNGEYPVSVVFYLYREGDYEMDRYSPTWILPQETLTQAPEGEGTWTWPETQQGSITVFEGERYQYNEATGYYHVYDPATGEYGPVLYALISEPHRLFSDSPETGLPISFFTLEANGPNSNLTYLANGTKNYKLFIEGYSRIIETGFSVPAEYSGVRGYGEFTNSDGAYPVTQELQIFLQEFATSQMYFQDGLGWAEINLNIYSTEDDQWLFACGYYS